MNFHWPSLLHVLQGAWDPQADALRTTWSVAMYCVVVTLVALAAALISTDMPFSGLPAAH